MSNSLRAGSGRNCSSVLILLAVKLSANLYDIYHCCLYSEKLLMMDRETVRNLSRFIAKNKFEKLVHVVGFIIIYYYYYYYY